MTKLKLPNIKYKHSDFSNITTTNNSKSEELTLEKLNEAIDILNNIPPSPKTCKFSKNTFNKIKDKTYKIVKSGLLSTFQGINIIIVNYLDDDHIEVEYTDGSIKLIKL